MTPFRSLNTSAFKRVLSLLKAGYFYLRLRKAVVKRITVIKFGVNGGDNGSETVCVGVDWYNVQRAKYLR